MQGGGMKQVGIVGGGELGQALARALRRKAIDAQLFDIVDDRTTVATLAELVHANRTLFLCVPSWVNRQVARDIAKSAGEGNPRTVITFSKGIEDHFVTMDKVLAESLGPQHVYGLAFGPMSAEELAVGRWAAAVLALSDMQWFDSVRNLLVSAKVTVEACNDMESLAVCGILKNVFAIAFGMNDGLHLGDNMKGKLLVLAQREMKQLLLDVQADPQLAEGLAGIGDIVTSGMNDSSFNYRIGKTIAEGIADEKIRSEGLVTLQQLGKRLKLERYPVVHALYGMIFNYQEPIELQRILES